MSKIAEITVTQDKQFKAATQYNWTVRDFGLSSDECVGMPSGHSKQTISGALLDAVSSVQSLGYDGLRVSYLPTDGGAKTFDCALASGAFDIERARKLADKLMSA